MAYHVMGQARRHVLCPHVHPRPPLVWLSLCRRYLTPVHRLLQARLALSPAGDPISAGQRAQPDRKVRLAKYSTAYAVLDIYIYIAVLHYTALRCIGPNYPSISQSSTFLKYAEICSFQ